MERFFAPPGRFAPCGIYTVGHLVLFLVTVAALVLALLFSRRCSPRAVRRQVLFLAVLLIVLELLKIGFVLFVVRSGNPNEFIPLYFCSLVLYTAPLSALGRGRWRTVGDVFLTSGGIVAGLGFLLFPTTSLPSYPLFHFLSWHSFFLHGAMAYLGILLLWRGGVRLQKKHAPYAFFLVSAMCVLAYLFNTLWDMTHPDFAVANLMFISKDFPATPVSVLYRLCGPAFPAVMWLIQALLPFWGVYALCRCIPSSWNRKYGE